MRPSIRAALIALGIAINALAAVPSKGVRPGQLKSDVGRAEVERWTGLLGAWGLGVSAADVVSAVRDASWAAARARNAVLAPVDPIFRLTGTGQAWGLFAFPPEFPSALGIEGEVAPDEWVVLYRPLDSEHDLLAHELAYRRLRGVYDDAGDRAHPGKLWDRVAQHIATEALVRRPDCRAVRVFMETWRVVPPGRNGHRTVSRRHVHTVVASE